MGYSFSTVYMAVIASNLILVGLSLCYQRKKLRLNLGYKLMAAFVIFSAIRFLFPLELPFTKTLLMPKFISFLISKIQNVLFIVGPVGISFWTFLQAIWILVFLYKLINHIRLQRALGRLILSDCTDVTKKDFYQSILEQKCKQRKRKNVFVILASPHIAIPMLYGIRHPRILIPEEATYSSNEMYYILSHEAEHHFHRDIILKNILQVMCLLYWWNPFCHVLSKHADSLMEMRIDNNVTKGSTQAIQEYLACLISIAQFAADFAAKHICPLPITSPILGNSDGDMGYRFQMLTESVEKKRPINIGMTALFVMFFIASYLVVFEAHYMDPNTKSQVTILSEKNAFAIEKEDGTYDIYLHGTFIESTESLQYYGPEIPVYRKEEYYNEAKQDL